MRWKENIGLWAIKPDEDNFFLKILFEVIICEIAHSVPRFFQSREFRLLKMFVFKSKIAHIYFLSLVITLYFSFYLILMEKSHHKVQANYEKNTSQTNAYPYIYQVCASQ